MIKLFSFTVVILGVQLPQIFAGYFYGASDCIGCYKNFSIEYFTFLSRIFPNCAFSEKTDFKLAGKPSYYVFDTCKNSVVSGSKFEQRYTDLKCKGGAVLKAYETCSSGKSLSDDEKANIKTYTENFEKNRSQCKDETYLQNELKYFQDLSNSASLPSQSDLNQTQSKNSSNTPSDDKTPQTNLNDKTSPRDTKDSSNSSTMPYLDLKDPNNVSKDNETNPPPPSNFNTTFTDNGMNPLTTTQSSPLDANSFFSSALNFVSSLKISPNNQQTMFDPSNATQGNRVSNSDGTSAMAANSLATSTSTEGMTNNKNPSNVPSQAP